MELRDVSWEELPQEIRVCKLGVFPHHRLTETPPGANRSEIGSQERVPVSSSLQGMVRFNPVSGIGYLNSTEGMC